MADLEGKTIGSYELIEKMGDSATGSVYRARQVSMDRIVTLLVLSEQLAANESYAERFLREARDAGTLSHPNLIRVYDVEESEGCYLLSMEHVAGETLHRILERDGKLTEKRAAEIAYQVADALREATRNDMVHGDIRLTNIIVDEEHGVVKLSELGLAKLPLTGAEEPSGDVMPYYAAPEVAETDEPDCRADIYSLGAVLYHAVTGQPPFEGSTAASIMIKHATEEPDSPASHNPFLSRGLCQVIEKAMAKDPQERYQSPEDFAADLDALREGRKPELAAAAPPAVKAEEPEAELAVAVPADEPAQQPAPDAPAEKPESARSRRAGSSGGRAAAGKPRARKAKKAPPAVAIAIGLAGPAIIVAILVLRWIFGEVEVTAVFKTAQTIENEANAEKGYEAKIDGLRRSIQQLERIQGEKHEAEAQSEIVRLRRRIKQVEQDAVDERAERTYSGIEEWAKDHPVEFDAIVAKYENLRKAFPGTPAAELAKTSIQTMQRKRREAMEAKLASLEKAANAKAQEMRFAEADTLYEAFINDEQIPDGPWKGGARRKQRDLRKLAKDAFEEQSRQAAALAQAGRYGDAIQVFDNVRMRFGGGGFAEWTEKASEQIRNLKTAQRQSEESACEELGVLAEELLNKRQYADVVARLTKSRDRFELPDVKEKARILLVDAEREKLVHDKMLAFINSKAEKPFTPKDIGRPQMPGEIVRATDEELYIQHENAEIRLKLSDTPNSGLYRLAAAGIDSKSPQENLALAVYCVRYRLWTRAQVHLAKADKLPALGAEVARITEKMEALRQK